MCVGIGCVFVGALAMIAGVPPTCQLWVSQSSPPKKTFTVFRLRST